MNEREWSDQQPPEWTGTPLGEDAPPSFPPAPAAPLPEATDSLVPRTPLSFSQILSLTWALAVKRKRSIFALALKGALLIAIILAPVNYFLNSRLSQVQWTPTDLNNPTALENLPADVIAYGLLGLGVSLTAQFIAQSWLSVTAAQDFLQEARQTPTKQSATGLARYISAVLTASLVMMLMFVPVGLMAAVLPNQPIGVSLAFLTALPFVVWFALGTMPMLGVVVVERLGGITALRRSLELSRQSRWQIFTPIFVVSLLASVIGEAIANFSQLVPSSYEIGYAIAGAVSSAIALGISVPFTTIATMYVYTNRRLQMEPPAADVFVSKTD